MAETTTQFNEGAVVVEGAGGAALQPTGMVTTESSTETTDVTVPEAPPQPVSSPISPTDLGSETKTEETVTPTTLTSEMGEEQATKDQMSLQEIAAQVAEAEKTAAEIQAGIDRLKSQQQITPPKEEEVVIPEEEMPVVLINPDTGDKKIIYNRGANLDLINAYKRSGYLEEGATPEEKDIATQAQIEADEANAALDAEGEKINDLFDDYSARLDARAVAAIKRIKEMYGLRK
jgi:TolA-binding protein